MRTKAYSLCAFTTALLLSACGGTSVEKTDCTDGQDNDGDGLIDTADPGCPFNGGQLEAPDPAACNDMIDNDGDGRIDLDDYGCETSTDVEEMDPTRACNDLTDNDGDGFADRDGVDLDGDGTLEFQPDPGCDSPIDDDEFNPPLCSNGVDDDVDGETDYPFDPGCTSADDVDEFDDCPTGPTCPQCSNGIDDDGDGDIDAADEGCDGGASDPDEFDIDEGECGPGVPITNISGTGIGMGSIAGPLPNQLSSPVCNGFGGEMAFTYTVTAGPVALLVTTDYVPETTLDTVLYVRTICQSGASELACDDDSGVNAPNSSTLMIPSVDAGTYYIIVDAYGPGSLGNFQVTVEERTALHGACDPSDPEPCIPGLICRSLMPGDPTTCEYHVCGDSLDNDGDGIVDFPAEPGCTTLDDDFEDDTCPGAGCPECGDGIDNDGDGIIDWAASDPGCDAASDDLELDECYPGKTVAFLDPVSGVTDSTAGETDVATGSCGAVSGAPELVFALTIDVPLQSITFDTDDPITTYDTVLYVREGECDSTSAEVGCNDNISSFNTRSSVTVTSPTVGETYFAFVDGLWGSAGTFHLSVSGVILPGGECDPAIPTFSCTGGFACQEMTPGGGYTCLVAECADGVDSDADGLSDFPSDPGCTSSSDDSEAPNPVTECFNMIDDDGDGLIDFSTGPTGDPGCGSASDDNELDECYPGVPVDIVDPATGVTDSTVGVPNSTGGSCGGSDSPEQIYAIRLDFPLQSITFDTDNATTGTFDTVLYVRSGMCDTGTEVACNDNISGSDLNSSVTITSPSTTDTYFIFVDSLWGAVGTFHLDVTGLIAPLGVCDPAIPTFACTAGNSCRESTAGAGDWACRVAFCNDTVDNDADGITDYPSDPGCTTSSDDTEDPNPVTECFDMIDNDGDGDIDFSGGDPGCTHAADNSEIDDCVAGEPVIDHPGGTVSGDTTGGPSLLSAPGSCDTSGSTGTTPERVYVFNNTRAGIANLHFTTAGSSLDTVLYLRYNVCNLPGPASYCIDNDGGGVFTSTIDIPAPAVGYWFAIVDGIWSGVGPFNLTIYGELATGATCTPGDVKYVCQAGSACSATTLTCAASACNDGIDNDGDGVSDVGDPGCADVSDNDESDTCPAGATCPDCGNDADDDGDGAIDYPDDTGCSRASDNNEMNCAHDPCVTGGVLASSCDTCVASICAVDSFCCVSSWDSICVGEVASVCGCTCVGGVIDCT